MSAPYLFAVPSPAVEPRDDDAPHVTTLDAPEASALVASVLAVAETEQLRAQLDHVRAKRDDALAEAATLRDALGVMRAERDDAHDFIDTLIAMARIVKRASLGTELEFRMAASRLVAALLDPPTTRDDCEERTDFNADDAWRLR